MTQITKEIVLDVSHPSCQKAIFAKQNDEDSRFLRVTLCNDSHKIDIAPTATVTINARRADGVENAFLGSVNEDGTITVPISRWMLAVDDLVVCSISVIDPDGQKLTSAAFPISVESSEYLGEGIADDEDYSLLVTLLTEVSDAESFCLQTIATANNAAIAAENAAERAETAADSVENICAQANSATASAVQAATQANNAANRAEEITSALGDKLDGIIIHIGEDAYLAKFAVVGGKPTMEYTKI